MRPTRTGAPRETIPHDPMSGGTGGEAVSSQALLAVYRPDIAQALADLHAPAYRYSQVSLHLFSRPLQPFSEATVLPSDMRTGLDGLGVSVLTLVKERSALDGTRKFLFSARDGATFEAVMMPYKDRVTACISSQVGCPVGCAFCATGAMGLRRNLTAAEIVDQVRTVRAYAAREGLRLSNLVYMGMGEPLLNLRAVTDSIRVVSEPSGLGLSHRAISVSTVGIPRGIRRLARVQPQVHLALSLHAADDRTRAQLVPAPYRRPIAQILEAAWEHFSITGRKLLVEYVLLRGVNDSADDARKLAALLRGHVVAVNLLPWNPVSVRLRNENDSQNEPSSGQRAAPPTSFRVPTAAAVSAFRQTLRSARVEAVVRRSRGGDIDAACGQLASSPT